MYDFGTKVLNAGILIFSPKTSFKLSQNVLMPLETVHNPKVPHFIGMVNSFPIYLPPDTPKMPLTMRKKPFPVRLWDEFLKALRFTFQTLCSSKVPIYSFKSSGQYKMCRQKLIIENIKVFKPANSVRRALSKIIYCKSLLLFVKILNQ